MIMVENIIYYAVLVFCVYYINGGGWRKYVFGISKEAYKELKKLEYMFFPKYVQRWKEKWFKPARFIWMHNIILTGISQVIGIILFIKITTKYQSFNYYYLIPLIFLSVLPSAIAILGAISRKVILEDMIEYIERRLRK